MNGRSEVHKLVWPAFLVARLARLTVEASEWRNEFGDDSPPRPQLILVKDDGIYLISNKVYAEGTTPRSEAEVFYAKGFDPEVYPFDDWWERAHDISGDDFSFYIDAAPIVDFVRGKSEEVLSRGDCIITLECLDRDEGTWNLELQFKSHKTIQREAAHGAQA